jgi:hypothetical protein
VSERKPNPQPAGPTDFPIARGVSPPPKPFRRVGAAPPPKITPHRTATIVESQFTFGQVKERVVVSRPIARKSSRIVALQVGAVVLLAGFCMAAGWWGVHHNDQTTLTLATTVGPDVVKAEPAKPVVVVKPVEIPAAPPKPVEKPAAPPKPVEKPVAPPPMPIAKPSTPPPPPPPTPPKSPDKPTTTLTFQKDILPILQARCVLCHGDKNKFKGGLDVRTLRTLEKGGESGPAINRQDPETSPLWDSVSSGTMPPGKTKLSESEKKKLHDWLVGGGK